MVVEGYEWLALDPFYLAPFNTQRAGYCIVLFSFSFSFRGSLIQRQSKCGVDNEVEC
jgi:hypothetical protein